MTDPMIPFASLTPGEQKHAHRVLEALHSGLNVVTGTVHAALAVTDNGLYPGVTVWLSGTSGIHAETAAIAAAASAGDMEVHSVFLAQRRADGGEAGHATPCGSCCQLIHDLATYTGHAVTVYSVNDRLDSALVLPNTELLPHAYTSQRLARAGAARRSTSLHDDQRAANRHPAE